MIVAVAMYALCTVFNRYSKSKTDALFTIAWMFILQAILFSFTGRTSPLGDVLSAWSYLVLASMFNVLAFAFTLYGSEICDSDVAAFLFFVEIPATYFIQALFGLGIPNTIQMCGITIILCTAVNYTYQMQLRKEYDSLDDWIESKAKCEQKRREESMLIIQSVQGH